VNKDKTIKFLNKCKYHNSFIYSDIPNLEFIYNDKKYLYYNYNYQIWYPINIIDNIVFVNVWIPDINMVFDVNVKELYCNLNKLTNYYNNLINYVNNNYYTNYNLIPNNYKELPVVPYTNIGNYLEFIKNKNKKIIFYYNVYPCSGQSFPINNHEIIIENLANIYNDYLIICCNKTNVNKTNVINTEDTFNNKHLENCENVARNFYYALNSDYIITVDVGVCLYILNDNIKNYKGKIIQINNDNRFYNRVMEVLNINNYINCYINNQDELLHKLNRKELI